MSIPTIKIKVRRKSVVKGKALVKFPAHVQGAVFIQIDKTSGVYTVSPEYSQLNPLTTFDPIQFSIAVQSVDGSWGKVTIADLTSGNAAVTTRVVTEAGDIVVGPNVRLLVMNRAVDEATSNIILPPSNAKIGDLKIVDFKGNAGSFPHVVQTQGSDEFQAGLTEWSISGDGASIVVNPISGQGYAV